MSATLFKEVSYSLAKLIQDIEFGEIGLPEIQRPFVWANTKVRDLFDSMFRGFPVGYLLFWASGIENHHRQIGTDAKQKVPRLLIVDGQQRLTSLYAVLKGISVIREDYRTERIYIAFRPTDQKFEVADAAIRRDPEFIQDISIIWSPETDIFELTDKYLEGLRASREVSSEELKIIRQSISSLNSLQSYPFTALELAPTVDEEQVAEVFVRINSKGTPLNQADFILTLMSVFQDKGRSELEYFCRQARQPSAGIPSPFNYFIQPDPDQLLRVIIGLGFHRARLQHVYSILRGKDLGTGDFNNSRREQQFAILKDAQEYTLNLQTWHEYFKVLIQAGYRRASMITSKISLLYAYTFFLIGKREYCVDGYILRNVIARWFFMTALTGRYTGNPETVMERDLNRLRDIKDAVEFVALLDHIIADTLTEDYWNITLINNLAVSSAQSPTLFAYYAALTLLDAKVLFSKMNISVLLDPALHSNKSSIERHHLFPKAYLKSIGVTETRDMNQIANYALVEWSDNIGISDAPPAVYFPEYAARFSSEELERMLYWHALPQDWENLDYQEFLTRRRKGIAKVIRDGFSRLWE